jgi:hypothetical protein
MVAQAADTAATALRLARALARGALAATIAALEGEELYEAEGARSVLGRIGGRREDARVERIELVRSVAPRRVLRDLGRRDLDEVLDGRDARWDGHVLCAVKARLAGIAASVVVVVRGRRRGVAVRRAPGALAPVATGACANDDILVGRERHGRIDVHLHLLDLCAALHRNGVKRVDTRQAERGA